MDERVAKFQEVYKIYELSNEILSRITFPAKVNKIYEAKVRKIRNVTSKFGTEFLVVDFITDNRETFSGWFSLGFPALEAEKIMHQLDLTNKDKKYRVVYRDERPNVEILKWL